MTESFTKYERARILGARGLQIAMDAPLLINLSNEELEKIKYDPIEIARIEFESGVLPITVKRPMPKKIERKLKREEIKKKEEDEKRAAEGEEPKIAKEVGEESEIVELVTPEDEVEEPEKGEEEGI
jgi:DNA-directed RNA polymerase subunit K